MATKIHRKLSFGMCDYEVLRVSENGAKAYFSMTVTNWARDEVVERVTFNSDWEADAGLLDRIATR